MTRRGFTPPYDISYRGVKLVRVSSGFERGNLRRVFQRLLPERLTPERCVEAYYPQRARFESIAERKLRGRQLTEDGDVEISGGTCEKAQSRPFTGPQSPEADPKRP
jgi:hypothetical protein